MFFDVAGIPWRYEEEGFDLSDVKVTADLWRWNPDARNVDVGSHAWYLPEQN